MKKKIINIVLTIVFAGLLFYFMLPPLNFHDINFWVYLIIITVFINILRFITTHPNVVVINAHKKVKMTPIMYLPVGLTIIFILILAVNIIYTPLLDAKGYSKRIIIDESTDFINDIPEVNLQATPLLDKESSQKLGDRVMGEMSELVSQFTVSDLYTQINYNNEITRVTPLEYASIIKYFTNHQDGIKGYITVNSVTGESKLVKLDKGMKYMPSAIFNEKLERELRFDYPREIFDDYNFEIDNEGNPYWIVPTIKYQGIGMKKEISGVIILDPITGKSKKYKVKDVPTWVDHVYNASLIMEQVDDWGSYKKGFINSFIGQKGVVVTTEGYNYTVMNDDVYLYTGITSVISDESITGFILCNMRTKDTHFYAVTGAKEYSAMASAEGQVQQMKYRSSFPLLINLNNEPTYLMSLKDNAGLVKMYAFASVNDYQKVVVTDVSLGINKAKENYLASNPSGNNTSEVITKEIQVKSLNIAIIDGNSYYYIEDNDGNRYQAKITVNRQQLPFIKVGDIINISYHNKDINGVYEITDIK